MIVKVNNLHKRYRKNQVLNDVNITIDEPQIIALVGPNGSGKTTLFNCMTNLVSINEGDIELVGKKNTDTSIFKEISYLQDNRILYGNLTAYDHLKFVCDVQDIPREKIQDVAGRIGMESYLDKRVHRFSLGMKQHLLLALVMINEPKLLLMDEPLNGLDPTSAINMRRVLLEIADEGTTIIISSHNLDEIDRLTNTIYFMKDGEILEESLTDFVAREYHIEVSDLEKAEQILTEQTINFVIDEQKRIQFVDTDADFQTVMNHLNEHNIEITNVEQEKIGAERRYKELFEGTTLS